MSVFAMVVAMIGGLEAENHFWRGMALLSLSFGVMGTLVAYSGRRQSGAKFALALIAGFGLGAVAGPIMLVSMSLAGIGLIAAYLVGNLLFYVALLAIAVVLLYFAVKKSIDRVRRRWAPRPPTNP